MLSKSQARAFFLVGTGLSTLAFVGLTVDSFRQIPGRTNESALTEEVIRGKELWEQNNCMGCHTLFGEGAYYAPELTKVYERRGPQFINGMLTDPAAMYPGQRKMQKYDFTAEEKSALVAFFKWCGEVDLNGFPAKPPLATTIAPTQSTVEPPESFRQMCTGCHRLGGQGGMVGPALDDVGARLDAAYLRRWLADPASVKPGTNMPKLGLDEAQLDELVKFLETRK